MPSLDVKRRLAEDVALWQADGIVDEATRQKLQARYDTPGFGLLTAAKYAGIAGGVITSFGILGAVAMVSASEGAQAFLLALAAGALAWAGLKLGRDPLARYVHSSKVVLALGVYGWAGAVGVGAHALGLGTPAILVVVGLGVLPLAFLMAYREQNGFLLLMCVLGFFHWVGSWNGMMGRNTYAFDVEDPRAMALVAVGVFAVGVWHERLGRPPRFHEVYQATALVYLNLSLLILSIYPERTALAYIAVFTAAALAQIAVGARLKSPLVMGFGVTALCVDLFTRYCERMWQRMSQGLFFLLGGVLLMAFGAAFERSYRRWRA